MTSFEIDRQTLKDLDLFNEDDNSIYSFFNKVKTIGGAKKLKELMQTPSSDVTILNSRKETVQYFYNKQLSLPFVKKELDFIEHYLSLNYEVLRSNIVEATAWSIKNWFAPTSHHYVITQGLGDLYKLLKILNDLNAVLTIEDVPVPIVDLKNTLNIFLLKQEVRTFLSLKGRKKMSYLELSYYDNFFRKKAIAALRDLLKLVYEFDAYIAISIAAAEHRFCFPEYDDTQQTNVAITGLFHPCIKNAVGNDVVINRDKNIFFLTGANMAGKSSFLKALGLAVYLAHVGFPVPAINMRTSVFNGLITTINLSDNINSGYSHYFSEVMRVKQTALKIRDNNNLFVIFDELFRGTNVKDAYDASLATIIALSKIQNSVFLISTHIVEIAAELKAIDNIAFKYFNSKMDKDKPVFDHKLYDGVSSETLGYFIFKNEGIVQILEQAVNEKPGQLQ